jgi:hypothetical protein
MWLSAMTFTAALAGLREFNLDFSRHRECGGFEKGPRWPSAKSSAVCYLDLVTLVQVARIS